MSRLLRGTCFVLGCLSLFASQLGTAGEAIPRMNAVLFLVDDHNYRMLGVAGHPVLKTPNIDRLASEGVFFTRCFTPNPICTPSRACLYTGQDSWTNGVNFNGKSIAPTSPLWPRLLADAGYETFFTGKWHSDGMPWTRGFTAGGHLYVGGQFDHFHLPVVRFGEEADKKRPADIFSSTLFSNDAIAFLEQQHAKPFCVVISEFVCHDPWVSPPPFDRQYDPEQMPLPPNFMAKPPFQQFNPKIRDETVLPYPRTESDLRTALAGYAGMMSHLDEQVGRVLDKLIEKKLADNTLVIFVSVKGLSLCSHGIIGKQTLYEEGVRSSLIVRVPGMKRDDPVCSQLVSTMDILPTLCQSSAIAIPESVDGKSLLGPYAGQSNGRERLFFSYHDPARQTVTRAIRTARHKYIHHLVTDERQLFDLDRDPIEMDNLAGKPEFASLEKSLADQLLAWRQGTPDR